MKGLLKFGEFESESGLRSDPGVGFDPVRTRGEAGKEVCALIEENCPFTVRDELVVARDTD